MFDESLSIYRKLLNNNPSQSASIMRDFVLILRNQSFLCVIMSQFEKGEQYAREALALDATQHGIYANLAAALLFQGKYDEAEAIYRQHKAELKDAFLDSLVQHEKAGAIPREHKVAVERIRKMLKE